MPTTQKKSRSRRKTPINHPQADFQWRKEQESSLNF